MNEGNCCSEVPKITAAGCSTIEVKLGDPIGTPDSGRVVKRIEKTVPLGDGWRVKVFDQDTVLRLEFIATYIRREGAFIGDSDRRYR